MDVMIHVTSRDSEKIALPLMRALTRANTDWGCFLTNDGVELLENKMFVDALSVSSQALVCEYSWEKAGKNIKNCPIEKGSQSFNSSMMGQALRLVSL
tara:strand:+ start:381 stop:674 length:294 start_codon:yes stop_codon:yes gene_type:complete